MTRYKLTIEYVGSDYSGWQKQSHVPSIQQAIEEAIEGFSAQRVLVQTAGRTDAGVHARGQVAHVDLGEFTKPMDEFSITKAINAHLRPQPISIINVEIVSDEFHARHDALNKLYRYRIVNRQAFLAVDRGLVWHVGRPLDVDAMRASAKYLLGHHDFTTFRDSECQANSPMKTLDRLDIQAHDYDGCGGREIIIETEGKSFLHHQVRNMVGTLSLVGLGKWRPEDMRTALEAKDRTKGGPTAPADGLYLVRVDYPLK
ncbi:MAG: tRNA pseudouridine(38-40) synthase TruA [Zetaproteobacteria bacterium]|nr:MAG: tRNA pseudouridine(38-40) synthase TruA [Zetaproteobacteria bacterium]